MNIHSEDDIEYGRSSFCRIVFAKRKNGTVPAKEFLDSLDETCRVRFKVLLKRLLDTGQIWNRQKLKKLQGNSELWEFISKPYRLFAFQDGKTWVLANGFEKRKEGTDKKHIDKGVSIKREYLETIK